MNARRITIAVGLTMLVESTLYQAVVPLLPSYSDEFHLSKASVAKGDKVTQGSKIGLAGHTGRTTGPHLHLSIHVPGGMVDPASFIKLPIYARIPGPHA